MAPKADSAFDYLDARILSCYSEAVELRRGSICRPRLAIIYPTYVCNHNCIGCDYVEQNTTAAPKMLGQTQLDDILGQVIDFGIPAVEFCGGGEPLLHPNIDEAILRLSAHQVRVGVLTNGTEISLERAALLTKHCSYVRVSVEAGCPQTFQRVKRTKSRAVGFERVIRNLERLVECRRHQGGSCQVSYKFAVDQNNFGDIAAAVALAADLGVDSIQFKSIRNVPAELSLEQKRSLDTQLTTLREKYPATRILGTLLPYELTVACWLSPLNVMIDPEGDLFLCCYYRHRLERHRYGNIFNSSLRELWFSDEHRKKLQEIRAEECAKYDCRFIRYASKLDGALRDGQLEFI